MLQSLQGKLLKFTIFNYVLIALVNSKSVKNEEQKRKFKTSKLCHFEFVAKKFIN